MKDLIVLPSGNVTPSLAEQEVYRQIWWAKFQARWRTRTPYVRPKRFIRPWDISTSGESSFRQNGYEEKVVDEREQARRDWRERKGFRRDKAKRGGCWCKCNLTDSRKGHRAWQRNVLRKTVSEDPNAWEELMEYDKDMFTSGWDCC